MSNHRNILEKLWCYPALDDAEKHELDKIAANSPEWFGHLQAARRWEEFLSSSKSLNDPEADDDNMAYAALIDSMPDSVVPEHLASALKRLKRRIEGDPDRQARYALYQKRLGEFETESDVLSHFEAVTGHSVSDEMHSVSAKEASRIARKAGRRPLPAQHRVPLPRGLLRGSAVVLGLYLVLFSFGHVGIQPIERQASVRTEDLNWTGLGVSTRGNDPAWERQLIDRYDAALSEAAESRKSFLGLFPSYDHERVSRARLLLEDTIRIQERLEPAPASAYLLLAKLSWQMHDSVATRSALISARDSGGGAVVDRAQEFLDSF